MIATKGTIASKQQDLFGQQGLPKPTTARDMLGFQSSKLLLQQLLQVIGNGSKNDAIMTLLVPGPNGGMPRQDGLVKKVAMINHLNLPRWG